MTEKHKTISNMHNDLRECADKMLKDQAILQSEKKYRSLFESMSEGFAVGKILYNENGKAADCQLIEINPAYERLIGISRKECLEKTVKELYPSLESKWIDMPASVVETGNPIRLEYDGKISERSFEIYIYSPGPGLFAGVFSEITERKHAENLLRESEERFRIVIENLPGGVSVLDPGGRFLFVNKTVCKYLGYSQEELLKMSVADIDPGSITRDDRGRFWHGLETGKTERFETYSIRKDGSKFNAEVSLIPITFGGERAILAAVFDITERKQSEEALRKSEERFRIAQESLLDAFTILAAVRDENGRIVDFRWEYVNPVAGRILRHAPTDLVGKRLLQVLPGNKDKSDLFDRYVRVVETGEPHDYELNYESEGIQGWFRNMTVKLGDGVAVHFSDITDRKHSEQKLRESESRLSAAVQIAKLGIWEYDTAAGVTRHDERCCQIFGGDKDCLISNERMFALIHPEDRARVKGQVLAALDAKGTGLYESEYRIILPNGTLRWVAVRGNGISHGEGADRRILRLIGTAMDVTERKRAEEELRRSKELFEKTFISQLDAIFLLDEKMPPKIIDCNPAAEKVFGYRREEMLGRTTDFLHVSKCALNRLREMLYPAAEEQGFYRLTDFEMKRQNEMIFPSEHSIIPLQDDKGNRAGWVSVVRDITERKRAEERLKQLNESLELQVAERTKLAEDRARQLQKMVAELTLSEQRERKRLAEILHDHMQQLLVGAKINGEVLTAGIGPEHKPLAENVVNLITKSLQTSRTLTAELSPPVLQQGSLSAALEWLARWMQEKNGFTVELKTDPSIDPDQENVTILLFQSVRELLFNVIKHAGVKSARVKMSRDEKDRLCVSVVDQGVGFDPNTILKNANDTGFGLFSIRERIELLGGSVMIESATGKGSAFSLFVPLETSRVKGESRIQKLVAQIHRTKENLEKIRVLLVDDHAVVRDGLSTKLSLQSDIEVVGEAADGEEAVKMAQGLQPDVILMDISMPKMNGVEAARIIHAEFPDIRIVGLSMYDAEDQAAAMFEAGASAYQSKSENTDLLLAAIRGEAG